MKGLYEKKELTFALLWIGVYVVSFSLADGLSERIGIEKLVTAVVGLVLMMGLYIWVLRNGLAEKYGFCRLKRDAKEYLYFLPLALLVSVNLWWGVQFRFTALETALYVFSMLCVGFLEELIFRGFLFKALSKDNLKQAIIISSVTFGVGHIVNLLNGAEFVPTMLQICYAVAAGFLFTYIFYTSGSLWPCILAHGGINGLSVFASDKAELVTNQMMSAGFLCVLSVAYSAYIVKTIERKSGSTRKSC